jgi:hypothetical protein
MTVSVPYIAGPLILLHVTPMSDFFTGGLSTNSTARHIQIGMGVFALSMAALMTVRSLTRRRQPEHVPAPSGTTSTGTTSTMVLDSNTPTTISPLGDRAQDAATEDGSPVRRLLGRAKNAWENGSLWVSFVIGVACVPPIDGAVFVAAIAVTSGAAIGAQVIAAIVFVLVTLVVVEIVLVSYLFVPAKTEAALRQLHNFALAHRRQLLIAIFAVAGVSMLAHGMGIVGAGS